MAEKHEKWMPLYITDYLGDTMHLTAEQHGAYLLLLMAAWKSGGAVPNDPVQLGLITRMGERWQTHAAAIVLPFFTQCDGMLIHRRVEQELSKAIATVEKKAAAGKAGAEKRWQNDGRRIADALPKQWQNDAPSPSPSPSTSNEVDKPTTRDARFDEFWSAYPKKVGKDAALKAWRRLKAPADTLPAILAALDWQKKSEQWGKDGGQYIPNPATYLGQGRWQDEPQPQSQQWRTAPSREDGIRAAASTMLSDYFNDDGTPKPPKTRSENDGRTIDATTPRLVG